MIAERYELQRHLAQGGMAEVWLAIDLTLDRKVAVKWLKPNLASDPIVAERFRREAIAAASLNHPNIVAVHDVFAQDGRQAVVMQLVEGKSLRQLLDTQKRLSPELTCHIGSCVALALDHAHDAGFVHRDVKPGNIMITSDGRVLLTDFGIAKALQSVDNDLTSPNIMMGTAKYLSPEQVRGKKLDGRADLYSLGLVLYECLAGRVPFLGESDADTALARLQRDPTDLSRLRATLPTGLVVVIHQLLARNPAHRPASGTELAASLREAAKEGPPPIDQTPHERSTIAPYGSRRLRRAPSDVAGRATDRKRAVRSTHGEPDPPPPPLPQRRPIPGEVTHTGLIPTTTPPPTPPTSDSALALDNTPTSAKALHGRPAKGLTQGWKPSFIVLAVLLIIGLGVGLLLWASLQFGGGDAVTTTTLLPGDTAPPAENAESSTPNDETGAAAAITEPAVIAAITAYDPDGDGVENDGDAALSRADNDSTTFWRTVCYESKYMGAKRGVGLVVSFDNPTQQALSVAVLSAPYQLQFFASDADTIPTTIDAWGDTFGDTAFADDAGTVTSGTPVAPVQHMLILLNELGSDDSCTGSNPYRGRLGEISISG
ncbi:MAG: serine/threonine protein kinase [Actinobacteria bacterium]|nr:serine/threonine protein kinase [Actinomycetota bacterium]